jgi:hypothetical protein
MFKHLILTTLIVLSLSACVSLNSISLTQVPEVRDHQISAKSDSWTLLGIAFSNDFVDEAVIELKSKCVDGRIEGILTKHQTTFYFLVFKREVVATGFCKQS